ncbi:MAG: 2-phospho-L-lactate guanylyltransferase [Gammaproteobacteria bacterium]|jgi:2-phospho-L-lactate/phosphoenolpyruvate guanylyltransferase|nr:2-phospho-L-lactate guanylyltransferase [Gammaproteobacteria bacterium]
MTTSAVIPIKQLQDAKQRLSGLLNSEERKRLFQAMVEDVLTAVEACTHIDSIVVVTNDQAVAELARGFGAEIRPEPEPSGLIEAVTETGKQLAAEGVGCMIFLPGDVPLVTPEELEVVLEGFGLSDNSEFMIVPASDLGGSNCVACSPPDCMSFGFGIDSFRKHLALARDRGIDPQVTKLPGIGLDIDTPSDISELMVEVGRSLGGQGGSAVYSTVRFLEEIGIRQRLEDEFANRV